MIKSSLHREISNQLQTSFCLLAPPSHRLVPQASALSSRPTIRNNTGAMSSPPPLSFSNTCCAYESRSSLSPSYHSSTAEYCPIPLLCPALAIEISPYSFKLGGKVITALRHCGHVCRIQLAPDNPLLEHLTSDAATSSHTGILDVIFSPHVGFLSPWHQCGMVLRCQGQWLHLVLFLEGSFLVINKSVQRSRN
jgi:hypothetical protein